MNGINGSNCCQGQMQGMQRRQGQGERFNKLDADGNGGIDQAELQTMADRISEITGQQMNVAEVSEANDANNDGLLDKNEMQSMMMELRGNMGMGGPQGGGSPSQQMLAAYQADPEMDLTSIIMDMMAESDEEKDEYNPVDLKA
jgi:EF hand domain-containing protein